MDDPSKRKYRELPKPKEIPKKFRHMTTEITFQSHPNYNKQITDILEELGNIEKNKGDITRFKAYSKASKALKAYPTKITSGKEASQLDGIGKKIAAKIDEILSSGRLSKLEREMQDDHTLIINQLTQVHGIGPSAAKKLVLEEGITSLEELKQYHGLNKHQQLGLKYFEALKQRIPREEMKKHEELLQKTVKDIDEDIILRICGSYRRGAPNSGDIDALITHPSYTEQTKKTSSILKSIVDKLQSKDYLIDHISQGLIKYMGICKLKGKNEKGESFIPRRIDIRLIPIECFWCGILYFTGSDFFNQQMRMIALEKGFTLSEYSICPLGETGLKGDPLPVSSEEDVFEYLRMEYKHPQERNIQLLIFQQW